VGVVEDVQFAMTADGARRLDDAAPLLAVRSSEGDEILIPFAKAFLVSMNAAAKRIDMTLPAGLVEVNRSAGGEDQKR
jgi:16S rRNA processing protein RimM